MPQLDQFTYLSQFVWLCVFYMSFYVLLMNDGLPKLSRILKLRAQLVSQHTNSNADTITQMSSPLGQDPVKTSHRDTSGTADLRALSKSVSYLNSCVSGASQWCNDMITTLNSNKLKRMNSTYLSSLGELGVSQVIKQSALETISPLTLLRESTALKTLMEKQAPRLDRKQGTSKRSRKRRQKPSHRKANLMPPAVLLNSIYVLRAQKFLLNFKKKRKISKKNA
jgi:F-type H+-transporting ATPase subunit b